MSEDELARNHRKGGRETGDHPDSRKDHSNDSSRDHGTKLDEILRSDRQFGDSNAGIPGLLDEPRATSSIFSSPHNFELPTQPLGPERILNTPETTLPTFTSQHCTAPSRGSRANPIEVETNIQAEAYLERFPKAQTIKFPVKAVDPTTLWSDYVEIANQCGADFEIKERSSLSLWFRQSQDTKEQEEELIRQFFDNADIVDDESGAVEGGEEMFQAKDKRTETYINVQLLRVQKSTLRPTECMLVLRVEFVAMENTRFKSAKITCSLSRLNGRHPQVQLYEPRLGYGDLGGPIHKHGMSMTPGTAPVTGTSGQYNFECTMEKTGCMRICGIKTNKSSQVYYNIKENPKTRHGIVRDFPIYIKVDSSDTFFLEVKVTGKVRGGNAWKLFGNDTVTDKFTINPDEWLPQKELAVDAFQFFTTQKRQCFDGWVWKGKKA